MDFTLSTYHFLLQALKKQQYVFQTFEQSIQNPSVKAVVLRHDVDRIPLNALKMARIECEMNIPTTYFFRIVNGVWNEKIVKKIAELGHEIGYHYEDLSIRKGNKDKAIHHFEYQLNRIREIYPVKTICMHGSPLSKYDNRLLWKHYDYKDYGINFEPYFDLDYKEVFYITDTGRQWNNENISVRDKVNSGFDIQVKSTRHLIQLLESNQLPNKIMINTHPHRWFNPGFGWAKELILQNIKNVVKYYLIKRRE